MAGDAGRGPAAGARHGGADDLPGEPLAAWLWHRAYIHAFQPRLKDYRLTHTGRIVRARQGLDRGVAAESRGHAARGPARAFTGVGVH